MRTSFNSCIDQHARIRIVSSSSSPSNIGAATRRSRLKRCCIVNTKVNSTSDNTYNEMHMRYTRAPYPHFRLRLRTAARKCTRGAQVDTRQHVSLREHSLANKRAQAQISSCDTLSVFHCARLRAKTVDECAHSSARTHRSDDAYPAIVKDHSHAHNSMHFSCSIIDLPASIHFRLHRHDCPPIDSHHPLG